MNSLYEFLLLIFMNKKECGQQCAAMQEEQAAVCGSAHECVRAVHAAVW
jgi:hypothetical protein